MIRKLLPLLLAVLLPATGWGAIVFEGSGDTWIDNGANPRSVAVQCGTNPNRVIYAGVATEEAPTGLSVTYNSVSLTEVASVTSGSANMVLKIFRLIAPASGSNNLTTSYSAGNRSVFGGICFSGVDQVTPNGTITTENTNGDYSIDVTSATGWVVDFLALLPEDAANITIGTGQTLRVSEIYDTALTGIWGSTEEASGTVTMSWSNITPTPSTAHAAFLLTAATGGAAPKQIRRQMVFQ